MAKHVEQRERSGVVLLSGGLDSCVAARVAQSYDYQLIGLFMAYGQKNVAEQEAAIRVAEHLGIELTTLHTQVARSPLTTDESPGPRTLGEIQDGKLSPWIVPARNTVFLALALSLAESRGMQHIILGATLEDNAGFPDCRPEFFEAFQKVAGLSAGRPIRVLAPLAEMSKRAVVLCGEKLKAPMHLTVSCYYGTRCGHCDACMLRADAFEDAGIVDAAGV